MLDRSKETRSSKKRDFDPFFMRVKGAVSLSLSLSRLFSTRSDKNTPDGTRFGAGRFLNKRGKSLRRRGRETRGTNHARPPLPFRNDATNMLAR